jgi:ribokinase
MDSIITVVGSINVDLVINSDRIQLPGETIKGSGFQVISGGKGANQAVAAARQGMATSFIGCIGDDDFGESQKENLIEENVNINYLSKVDNESTGVAVIVVETSGDNRIILSPGANDRLTPELVEAAEDAITRSKILICQLETPLPAVKKALEIARKNETITVLNPAPAVPLDSSILSLVDYLIPNETEAAILSGVEVVDVESAKEAAKVLAAKCSGTIIITMGEHGVLTATDGKMEYTEAFPVKAIDTTAAGDTFIGTLASFISEADDLETSVTKAMCAAAISVTKIGAQTSIPNRKDFQEFYLQHKRD